MTAFNRLIVAAGCLFFYAGCTSNEIGFSKDVNQQSIWQEYSVHYTEGEENAEVFCQFRFAGEKGTTLVLSAPAKIEFDGKQLTVDSSDFSGAFYRTGKPVAGFGGTHRIVYTDTEQKKYENSFSLDTFRLVNVPAQASLNKPFEIKYLLPPLGPDDYIQLASENTDSSFTLVHHFNDGNKIKIPQIELQRQKAGSFTIIPTLYRKKELHQKTNEGGKIEIIHTLRPVTIKLPEPLWVKEI